MQHKIAGSCNLHRITTLFQATFCAIFTLFQATFCTIFTLFQATLRCKGTTKNAHLQEKRTLFSKKKGHLGGDDPRLLSSMDID